MKAVKHWHGTVRATLVEYSDPQPVLQKIAMDLGAESAFVRDQIISAGERVARILSLSNNPICVSGTKIQVANVAGLLRVGPRLELEIAPKFLGTTWVNWREDFFFISMLSRHGRLLANERLGSAVGAKENLATLVARAMIVMYWENQRRPLRTYRLARIEDFVVDGEVDPESIVLPSVDGYEQQLVTYDRRNIYNAAILSAAYTLIPETRDPQTQRQLIRVAEYLSPQLSISHARHCLVPNRAKRWQALHDLAIDILRGFGIAYNKESARAPGYILDTWRVWEDLLTIALRMSLGSNNLDIQRSIALGVRETIEPNGRKVSKNALVTPDIYMKDGTEIVLDAKYKGRISDARNRILESDLYEALAFAAAAKRRKVLLLYPAIARGNTPKDVGTTTVFERITVDDVSVIGIEVEVRGISRTGALKHFANNIKKGCRTA